jgi:hypothetical protein
MIQLEAFEEIYRDYLQQVALVDLEWVKDRLGLTVVKDRAVVPFFGMPYGVSAEGVTDQRGVRPSHTVCVILCRYLILCPERDPRESDWVTYREFKDAAPFVSGFHSNAQEPIGRAFGGRLSALERAGADLGATRVNVGISADLVMRFHALPRVPVLMLFNDRDEEFPAQCILLFERRADKYLDMECLAMIGWVLSEWLQQRGGEGGH